MEWPDARNHSEFSAFVQRSISLMGGRAAVPLYPIVAFAIVQAFRYGILSGDYLLILTGCIVSFISIPLYGLPAVQRAEGEAVKSWMALAAMSGLVPYVFSLYLVFYRGIWGFISGFGGISFSLVIKCLLFIVFGYKFLRRFWVITEFCKEADLRSADRETVATG